MDSKKRTRPSRVWCWSMEGAKNQNLIRLQHSTHPKQCSSWPQPQRRAKLLQSDQSNWNSSPGTVSMGMVTITAPLVGPRTECR